MVPAITIAAISLSAQPHPVPPDDFSMDKTFCRPGQTMIMNMNSENSDLMELVSKLSLLVQKWRIQADALEDLKKDKEIQTMILRNRKNADEVEIIVGQVVSRQPDSLLEIREPV
jgi:hypothetical protein